MLLLGVLDPDLVTALARAAAVRYAWVEDSRAREGPDAVALRLPIGQRFVPTASSLSLASLDAEAGFDVARAVVSADPLRGVLLAVQGGPVTIDLDQAWLRRQYAPGRYPERHAPHAWHQDGALGYDFLAAPLTASGGPGSLLPMVTGWAPLTPCGRDAPGIEVIATPLDRVRAAMSLSDEAIRRDFGRDVFWTPAMEPGDVLLMHAGALHHTHVTAGMTRDRTSVEVRVFPAGAPPARLAADRFSERIA